MSDWYRQSPTLRNGTAFPKPADNLDAKRREKQQKERDLNPVVGTSDKGAP